MFVEANSEWTPRSRLWASSSRLVCSQRTAPATGLRWHDSSRSFFFLWKADMTENIPACVLAVNIYDVRNCGNKDLSDVDLSEFVWNFYQQTFLLKHSFIQYFPFYLLQEHSSSSLSNWAGIVMATGLTNHSESCTVAQVFGPVSIAMVLINKETNTNRMWIF